MHTASNCLDTRSEETILQPGLGTKANNNFSISRFSHRRHDDGENLVEMDDGGMVDVDFDQTAHSGENGRDCR